MFQTLIKDPKISTIVMNPHVKRSIKQKTFSDALTKAKVSPITINLISKLPVADLLCAVVFLSVICFLFTPDKL